MGHLLSNHCGELGLAQETDLELLLCRFVDLDMNFYLNLEEILQFSCHITLVIVLYSCLVLPVGVIDQPLNL